MTETETVTVAQGALRGREETSKCQKAYYSFQGIPYAKPPVGSLRFKVGVRLTAVWGALASFGLVKVHCGEMHRYSGNLPIIVIIIQSYLLFTKY
jgi:carboxylesterase type B